MSDPGELRTAARPPRRDATAKVTGGIRYAADVAVPGLLHARLVLSPHVHARIVSIDGGDALASPGVVAVLTAADLPVASTGDTRAYTPLARDEVVFAGQPVALVVAESEAAAEDAVDRVEVAYEPLPAAIDVERSLRPGGELARLDKVGTEAAVNFHGTIGMSECEEVTDEPLSDNVVQRYLYRDGDLAAAFEGCPAVEELELEAGWIHQLPLETPVATASLEADGTLFIESSTQGVFLTQQSIASVFGLPLGRVRVAAAPIGGSFGSKFVFVEPIVAGAALKLRAPVRLAMTRTEEMLAGNPAAATSVGIRVGAGADGRLSALDARLVFDDGAFSELSCELLGAFCAGGPYRWDAFNVKSLGVETNRFGTGAYRAPGGPQSLFAIESAIDELAERLGLDPIEMRLANLAATGEPRIDGGAWPRHGVRECLELVREHPLWQGRGELPEGEGVGVGVGIWPGARDSASALCRLDADGGLTIATGMADMTGVESTYQALAAAALDLPLEMVRVTGGDSHTVPYAPPSGGSSATYVAGVAVRNAAMEVRRQVLEIAAEELEIAVADLVVVDGAVGPRGAPSHRLTVAEIAASAWAFGGSRPPVEALCSDLVEEIAPLSTANLVHVRVDPLSCEVEVLAVVAVQDVGRALHPALIEEQMHGGAVQGLGRALHEELLHDAEGKLLTDSLMTYAVPTAADVPAIETHLVEVPSELGPLGARGVGEGPVLAVPAAVGNAIKAATGLRMRRLPITPARIWSEMAETGRKLDRPFQGLYG